MAGAQGFDAEMKKISDLLIANEGNAPPMLSERDAAVLAGYCHLAGMSLGMPHRVYKRFSKTVMEDPEMCQALIGIVVMTHSVGMIRGRDQGKG